MVVDAVSGDLPPLALERLASDRSVAQSAEPVGAGGALSLRWSNPGAAVVADQRIRVAGAACGAACPPGSVYRIRALETTAFVPRFNNSASQATLLVLQNTGDAPLSLQAWFRGPAGDLPATSSLDLAPHASAVVNTAALPGLAGASGSLSLTHDGHYGQLAGKAVSPEPATGFAFDTPLQQRPR